MTHHPLNGSSMNRVLEVLNEEGFEGVAQALELLMNEAMKLERSEFLQAAPYERSDGRRGYANGFKPKRVATRSGPLDLKVPQVRGRGSEPLSFYPQSLEKGVRSERALKLAIAEMYVQGVSTRKVAAITQELCGMDISSSQVSRLSQLLDEELERWRTRALSEIRYLLLDARYEKVRHGGSVVSMALLWAIGVTPDGRRMVLGVSVSPSEAEVHWREFLENLQDRGLHGIRMVTSDDHAGLKAALAARLTGVPWQRCQCHLQRNAQHHTPRIALRPEVVETLRGIFNATDSLEANDKLRLAVQKFRDDAPELADWMEENVPQSLTVLDLPAVHRRRLRTTNGVERINREIKRRTRVAGLFPNVSSLLRLASAVLAEISDEWESDPRRYLNMEIG